MAVESETGPTDFSSVELALATRNHGLPLEALRYDLTPVGLHYLLIRFDIPQVDAGPGAWRSVERCGAPFRSHSPISERPPVSVACTLECAGNRPGPAPRLAR